MITNVLHRFPQCACMCVCVGVSVNELPKVLEKYAFFAHNMPHGHGHSIHCVLCFAAKEEKKRKKILAAKKEGSLLKPKTL